MKNNATKLENYWPWKGAVQTIQNSNSKTAILTILGRRNWKCNVIVILGYCFLINFNTLHDKN